MTRGRGPGAQPRTVRFFRARADGGGVTAGHVAFAAAAVLSSTLALAQVRPDAGQVLEQTREPLRLSFRPR